VALTLLTGCKPAAKPLPDDQATRVRDMVQRQLQQYPQSRLIDLYKTCFQDYMGPEHQIDSRTQALNSLTAELGGLDMDSLSAVLYEPCGVDSQYYRINLRTVADGTLPLDTLLDAFVASGEGKHPTVEQWQQRWQQMQQVISGMHLQLPHYGEDSTAIAAMLEVGDYALSHSDDYRKAYYPHYRLVSRDIFESRLRQRLDARQAQK